MKKQALGKGLASLLNTASSAQEQDVKGRSYKSISVKLIAPNPDQPRKIFKNQELEELAKSVQEVGIIQPLLVSKTDQGYQIIAGERRFRAALIAGLKEVPVVVQKITERERQALALIENIQRSELNCIEEAVAYAKLIREFKLTQEEVAKQVGKERSSISNLLRLLDFSEVIIGFLQQEKLSLGHGKVLLSVKSLKQQEAFARQAIDQELSVRALEKLIKQPQKNSKQRQANKYESLASDLEKKTGFQIVINASPKGKGKISLSFQDKNEFNRIYDFLTKVNR